MKKIFVGVILVSLPLAVWPLLRPPPLGAQSAPATCQQIIEDQLVPLKTKSEQSLTAYERLFEGSQRSLDFIANNLAQMALDASALDQRSEELDNLWEDFVAAEHDYSKRLDGLLVLSETCAQDSSFENSLRAALSARDRLETAAEQLVEFFGSDLESTLEAVERQLEEIPQTPSR